MTRFASPIRQVFTRYSRIIAVSIFALIFLGACYQEVPVTSTPTPEVITAPDTAPTKETAKEPEKKPDAKEKPAGGGGGGGGAATPIVVASPTLSCLTGDETVTDQTVAALPTCTPVSSVKLPGTPVVRPGTPLVTTPGAVKTPVGGTKPIVTPPATVKSGTVPTVKPGTTPAGVKTAAVPTVKSATTPIAPTVKAGATMTPTVKGSPTTSTSPPITMTATTTTISTVAAPPTSTTATPSMTATLSTTTEMGVVFVTKRENFANEIVPGACFSLITGGVESAPVCDQQEGDRSPDPGVIGLEGPVGPSTLHETTPPDGYEAGADVEVMIAAGTPTAIDIINHLIKKTDTLVINKVDPSGSPVAGSCFDLVGTSGTVTPVCDDGLNDESLTPGAIQLEVMSDDYLLKETPPAGYQATEVTVSVIRGSGATVDVVNTLASPTLEPTTTAVGVLVANIVGPDGATLIPGACLTLTGATTYSFCDNQDPDQDLTDGVIEVIDIAVGDYAVTSTPPEGLVELAPAPAVTITENGVATVALSYGPADVVATTEPTVAADGVVLVQTTLEDGVTPLVGVCLTLTGPATLNVCDNLDGDPEPTDGVIELDAVPAGDYTVAVDAPEGYELAAEAAPIRVESGGTTPLNLIFRQTTTVQTGVLIVQSPLEDGVTFIPGLCVTLTGSSSVNACDNINGDVEPTEGVIEFEPIPAGEYAVEIIPPAGYEIAIEIPASIQITPDTPTTLTITLRPVTVNGSIQIIKVDAADGTTPLGGSCWELTGPAGTTAICDDDENDRDELVSGDATPGVVVVADLPPGDYLVHESTAPVGFDLAADQTANVAAGNTTAVTFADTATVVQTTGTLLFSMTDSNGNLLPGACLSVVAQFGDGQIPNVDRCDGGEGEGEADGQIALADLLPGIYQVTETSAPAGYLIVDSFQVEIPVEGGEIAVPIVHTVATGSLLITTLDPNGAPVAGACFTVVGPDGASADWCDDDGDGNVVVDGLLAGDYTVRVLSLPEQFVASDVTEQVVSIAPGVQATLGFTSQATAPTTVSLQVLVTDESGQPVGSACFDIQGPQSSRVCDDVENDGDPNPGSMLVVELMPGEYTVTQTAVAPDHTTAEPQLVTLDAATPVAQLSFVNTSQPSGLALGIPAVYSDDAGRLWLLRPNDTQPSRLDSDERPWDQRLAPVASYDHVEIAFLINNPDQPTANMVWVKLEDLSVGSVDFGGVGTPVSLSWVPGRNDLLIVAVQLPDGLSNLYFFNTQTQELTGPVFSDDQRPASVDGIIPSPTSTLVALQTTGSDGDADTWLFDSNPDAQLSLTNVGPNDGAEADFFAGWNPAGDALLVRSGVDSSVYSITNFARTVVAVDPNPIYQGVRSLGTAPAWSPDGQLVSYFDNDPAAGGQLHINRVDGTPVCDPIPNVQSAVWSTRDVQLWALMNVPDSPQSLVVINVDCSQQALTTFDPAVGRMNWGPGGVALALISNNDGNTTLAIFSGDAIVPVDMAKANVAFADILTWSPGGEVLAIYAGGPSVSLWVVVPGSDAPVPVAGSTVPEGASYITSVWWP